MRILALFIFLITTAEAGDLPNIKNIVIHKVPKTYENVFFLNKKNERIKINDFKGKLLVLNFWATWCPPCEKEMPSLDNMQANSSLNNLKVFPINIGKEKLNSNYTIVKSLLIATSERPEVKIDWRIYTKNPDNPLIRDLIIEGLSLARTQREEFTSILNLG